ncbi:MAG TPA: hypothetical protein VGC72_10615 [Candidatus Elarobacter sp.]
MLSRLVFLIAACALAACGGGGGTTGGATSSGGGALPPGVGGVVVTVPTASPVPTATPTPLPTIAPPAGVPAWNATQRKDYVAIAYGGNPPEHISVYAPGQSVASATLTYNGCCYEQIAFDAQGNLIAATTGGGIFIYAPGIDAPPKTLPLQSGFALAVSAQGDLAVGGYNMGATSAVYLGGAASAMYRVPAQPAAYGLAFSPTGELAAAQSNGSVQTFARGSTTPNRTLPVNLEFNGTNFAVLAYDSAGNLAVGSGVTSVVPVFAPGATTPAYTITGLSSVQSLAFDSTNQLVVGENIDVKVFAAGSATLVRTISNNRPVGLAVDADGDIALAGWTSPSMVYQGNGNVVTINGLFQAESVAISP